MSGVQTKIPFINKYHTVTGIHQILIYIYHFRLDIEVPYTTLMVFGP